MTLLNNALTYILSLETYVLIPLIMLLLALSIGLHISEALKSSITIGIGFLGISIIFSFFIDKLGPAVKGLTSNLGFTKTTLDIGWTPLALTSWDVDFAAICILLILLTNIILLIFKFTHTMNIDIFNFWHILFVGAMVQILTGSTWLALIAAIVTNIIMLKLADWIAPFFEAFTGLEGITTSTLSALTYLPVGVIGGHIFDRIPWFKDITADAKAIKNKFGMFGDPLIIGFIIGIILGICAGYPLKGALELAVQFAAVIFILPRMTDILAEGLKPVSAAMHLYIQKKFPFLGKIYIGVDTALILGEPSVLVTGIFLIPISIGLALILPGVSFIPLGDLSLMMILLPSVVISNKGNVIRSLLLGIPIIIGHLYASTAMADVYTEMAHTSNLDLQGYEGTITSFIDGGNLIRFSIVQAFNGQPWAYATSAIIIGLMYTTWRLLKK